MSLQHWRNNDLVRGRRPSGVIYEKRKASCGMLLTRKCLASRARGLMGLDWSTKMISCPSGWVLVCGRRTICALGSRVDLFRLERNGNKIESKMRMEEGRSSPRRHWPQKAIVAQAEITISKGESRSRCWINWMIILAVTGGRGGCLEHGVRLCTPFIT